MLGREQQWPNGVFQSCRSLRQVHVHVGTIGHREVPGGPDAGRAVSENLVVRRTAVAPDYRDSGRCSPAGGRLMREATR